MNPPASCSSWSHFNNPIRMKFQLSIALLVIATTAAAEEPLKPRQVIRKPAKSLVDPATGDPERIYVKFRDDFSIRLRDAKLAAAGEGSGPVAALIATLRASGVTWTRQHRLTEEKLSQMRATAQRNTGKVMPDLNTEFILRLPAGMDPARVMDQLNALDAVEIAQPMPKPAPPPAAGNYESQQGYLNATTDGVGARAAWNIPGGTGTGVKVADIEYAWNLDHVDFTATLLGPEPDPPVIDGVLVTGDHGTAVLGEMAGKRNNSGVTGIAYGSTYYVATSRSSSGFDPAGAITTATGSLDEGDILLLEMQADAFSTAGAQYCPSEWNLAVYNAVVTAVGNGIIIVAAAGNGAQNLDDPAFNTGHAPFRPENDSGAIIVGAGAAPGSATGDRSRLDFSTYGSRVNVQGWGESVTTTGYGDLHNTDGANYFYTSSFNGTSSASPIVAATCAVLQGIHKASHGGAVLSPREMRAILMTSGAPQTSGTFPAGQHIGPRPNMAAAIPIVQGSRVWVDFSFVAIPPFFNETGSFNRPYNTYAEAVTAVPSGGNVLFKTGSRPETITVSKPMTLHAHNGPVTIGQ